MQLIYFYSVELLFLFVYLFISFILCSIILIYNVNLVLLFTTFPFLKLFVRKFIITHVTDLFDVTWILVGSASFLFILPLFAQLLLNFLRSSWYVYQINIFKKILFLMSFAFSFSLTLCYTVLTPSVLIFLTYWGKIEQTNSILIIETELRVLNFVHWILHFQYSFVFLIVFYSVLLTWLWFLIKVEKIYFLIKFYRKQGSFISLLLLFLLSPSDIFLQLVSIFFIISFYELVFLFVCYKVTNSN